MAIAIIVLCLIVAALFLYAIVVRPWLKTQPWAVNFFAWVEPLELALFKKSETILVGRLLWVGGLFVTFYDGIAVFFQTLDLTPITTRILDAMHIPTDMRGLTVTAFIAAMGRLITWLRDRTTQPIELVAVSDKQVAENPHIAEAIAMADSTKAEAVQVVASAKAS